MNKADFAKRFAFANEREQHILFHSHTELINTDLAWSLKTLYDQFESNDPAKAGQIASALASLERVVKQPQVHALTKWTSGMVALDNGQIKTAIPLLEMGEAQFLSAGLPLWAANVQVSRLRALAMQGKMDEALKCGYQAREIFLAHQAWLPLGKIEQNLGNIHFLCDRYVEAEDLYRSAREHYGIVGDQKQLAQVDNCLATTLTSQHRFHEAEQIYAMGIERAEAAGSEITLAEIEANQGCLFLFQGHFDRALEHLEKSRRRYFALGLLPRSAVADQELADAYLELNLFQEATAIYERIIPIFSELGMQAEHARALVYHGRACLARGQIMEARTSLAKARGLYKNSGNRVGEAIVTLIEAEVLYAEGEYAAASDAASYIEPIFAEVNAWGRFLSARWLRGDVARIRKHTENAETLLKNTLKEAMRWSVLPVVQRCYTSLGLLARERGDHQEAERLFKVAITFIEETRAPLPAEEFRIAFLTDKLTPFTEMVRLCLADGSQSRIAEALEYVERGRSRALVDFLTGALSTSPEPIDEFELQLLARLETLREELNWFYTQIHRPDSDAASRGAEMMTALYNDVRARELAISEITLQIRQHRASEPIYSQPVNLQSLAGVLGNETVLVEYFSLDGRILAFIVTANQFEHLQIEVVQLPGTEEDIINGFRQLHFQLGALRHGADRLQDYLPDLLVRTQHHLGKLYELLLRPIEERIDGQRLVIIPHRAIHYIPFHALWDGISYVIERREICCVPGITVLKHCLDAPRQPHDHAVLFGISDARTPRVRDEVLALGSLFERAIVRLDDQATRASLFNDVKSAQLLHLACHGRFRPDNPLYSSLQLGDGWLTVRDVYKLKLNCDLVTLSACETGVSTFSPGDELMGLARGFFSAGVPSLLVSLWMVDDEATTQLMIDFYTHLQTGTNPAAALRQAQCQAMQKNPHPYYWAPFILMGRW